MHSAFSNRHAISCYTNVMCLNENMNSQNIVIADDTKKTPFVLVKYINFNISFEIYLYILSNM